jgi:hypothetical protein
MIIIVWNPTRFHVTRVLPSGCKFNSSYYIQQNEIFEPFSEWVSEQAGTAGGILIVHADNARPHTHRQQRQRHHITAIDGRERDGKSSSPILTLLAGLDTF